MQEAYSYSIVGQNRYVVTFVEEEQLFKLRLIKFNTLKALVAILLMYGNHCIIVLLIVRPRYKCWCFSSRV